MQFLKWEYNKVEFMQGLLCPWDKLWLMQERNSELFLLLVGNQR